MNLYSDPLPLTHSEQFAHLSEAPAVVSVKMPVDKPDKPKRDLTPPPAPAEIPTFRPRRF